MAFSSGSGGSGIYNHDIINDVLREVKSQMEYVKGIAATWGTEVTTVMGAIGEGIGVIADPPGSPTYAAPSSPSISAGTIKHHMPLAPVGIIDFSGAIPTAPGTTFPGCATPTQPIGSVPDITDPGGFTHSGISTTVPDISISPFVPTVEIIAPPAPPPITMPPMPSSPGVSDVAIPDAPDITFPPEPDWITVEDVVGEAPEMPTFDMELETEMPEPPTLNPEWEMGDFTPTLINESSYHLLKMAAGNGVLDRTYLDFLLSSQLDQQRRLSAEAVSELTLQWANRGFATPPGAMEASLRRVRRESSLKERTTTRDMTVKVMDLEAEGVKIALPVVADYEKVLLTAWTTEQTLTLDFVKTTLDANVKAYSMAVEAYKAKLAEINAHVAVFEAEVKGVMAQYQAIESQVKLQISKGQLNNSMAQVYSSQVDAIKAYIGIYTEQIRAAEAKIRIDGIKIDNYGKEITATTEIIRGQVAYLSSYGVYASIASAQANIASAEASAYKATVDGKVAGVDAAAKTVSAEAAVINAESSAYKATASTQADKMRAYSARAQAIGTTNSSLLQQNTEMIRAAATATTGHYDAQRAYNSAYAAAVSGHYSAQGSKLQAYSSYNSAQAAANSSEGARVTSTVKAGEANARIALAGADALWKNQSSAYSMAVNTWLKSVSVAQSQATALINAQVGAGQVYAQLSSGALAGVHVSANAGGQASNQASNSSSWADNETHSFAEKCCETN